MGNDGMRDDGIRDDGIRDDGIRDDGDVYIEFMMNITVILICQGDDCPQTDPNL
jgi:hypothetical protein